MILSSYAGDLIKNWPNEQSFWFN